MSTRREDAYLKFLETKKLKLQPEQHKNENRGWVTSSAPLAPAVPRKRVCKGAKPSSPFRMFVGSPPAKAGFLKRKHRDIISLQTSVSSSFTLLSKHCGVGWSKSQDFSPETKTIVWQKRRFSLARGQPGVNPSTPDIPWGPLSTARS